MIGETIDAEMILEEMTADGMITDDMTGMIEEIEIEEVTGFCSLI